MREDDLMTDSLQRFEKLLYNHLIPEFCEDASRLVSSDSFRKESQRIGQLDAEYFLKAWNNHLVKHRGRGLYRTSRSCASEQFFWTGKKVSEGERAFTLWLEPVITVGGLARLHFDWGWPEELIGTQSSDWAFDLVAYLPGCDSEIIAGEVKKTRKEIDELIELMNGFCKSSGDMEGLSAKERNALRKVAGLRRSSARVFWALGPDGYSRSFIVSYSENEEIHLQERADSILDYALYKE